MNNLVMLSRYSQTFYDGWCANPNRSDYNIVSDQELGGEFDPIRLERALKRFSKDFIILHSKIQNIREQLYWVEDDDLFISPDYFRNALSDEDLLQYVQQPFNLATGPLIRIGLINLGPGHFRLLLVIHHIIMDGAKVDYFIDNLSGYYNDKQYKGGYTLETQRQKFSELYNKFDNLKLDSQTAQTFWESRLQNVPGVDLRFLEPFKSRRADEQELHQNSFAEYRFSFDTTVVDQFQRLKKQYALTPYLFGQAVFAVLLHQYTGQDEFAICYPVSVKEGMHFIYGVHINVNVIPFRLTDSMSILEILQNIKTQLKEIKQGNYHYHPFEQVLTRIKDKSVLDVGYIQTNLRDTPFHFDGINKVKINHDLNIDLLCRLLVEQELKEGAISYRVRYDKRYIDSTLLLSFIEKYQKLFEQIMDDLLHPQFTAVPISTYQLIDQNQANLIQALCNPNFRSYPAHQTIHQRFEEQVLRTPDHIAIVCEGKQLTYSELNTEANRLAHYLTKQSMIRPDDLVLVCLDRSEHTVITLLAVLKTGGAYVPVTPHHPDNRIAYILNDAKPSIVLTNAKHTNRLQGLISDTEQVVSIIAVDDQIQHLNGPEADENLNTATTSQHLAYVIYTSGTTGKPKGVLQQHNNVIRLFEATREWYQFNAHDVWTLFHSYVFDFSVWEIWGALFHGGKLIIPSTDQIRDLPLFVELCRQEKVTVLNLTPAVLYHFVQLACDNPGKKLTSLRYIVSGGDKLNLFKLRDWFELYGEQSPKMINMYGITETTVHVMYKEIQKAFIGPNSLIGWPIPDQKIYVLDRTLNLLPVGAVGELYVGGAGLSRGYLNQPELTKEKFIANPYQTVEEELRGINSTLYKTGDLVRIFPDGSLEYIGRVDTQLKIRGYRIEAGEIETLLCDYPGIKQAVVLAVDYQEPPKRSSADHRCQHKATSSIDLFTVSNSRNEIHQEQIDVQNQSGMLPIQEWFFAQKFKNVHHFNQSFLIKTPHLNVDILAASVAELVRQYDCFSLRYLPKSGVMQSHYVKQETQGVTIQQLDIRTIPYSEGTKEFNDKIYEILTGWQTNFNIVDGPMYSTGYISGYKDGSTRVYFAMHHLIVDVVSWHIIVHGLQKAYNALASQQCAFIPEQSNQSSPLAHHGTSYQQWANLVRSYGFHNTQEKAYWLNVIEGHQQFDIRLTKLAGSNFGTDEGNKPVNTPISFTINKNDSETILSNGKQVFRHQVNAILLTALGMTLKELLEDSTSGSNEAVNSIYVTMEGHGREDIHSKVDISHTPGWFTTMYPCKLAVEATNPLEIIKSTQQTLDAVPVNGLGYGALFGYNHGLPRIRFNYLGQLNTQDEHSYWCITGEPSGQSVDSRNENSNVIDWVCWAASGQLEFTLISQLDQHQTNQLVEIFKAKLVTLVKLINQQDKDQTWGNNKLEKCGQAVESTTRLVAYCASDTPLEPTAISTYLSQHLPSYSVPQDFIWLETMPLTTNGKVDVEAFPKENHIDGEKQVLPRNEKEIFLCEAFAKVLHKKRIGIYDDFFLIGGDSISAITLVMHLQRHFQVNVRDIYSYRTPCQLAEKLTFSSKTIKSKLLEMKHDHEGRSKISTASNSEVVNDNLNKYLSSIEKLSPDISPKKIKNVLLTGATGYLGCNLLDQLLTCTDYNIYLLVRAESDQLALERVNNKYQRYFFSSLPKSIYKNRVFVVCADLEKADFGLSRSRYSELTQVIDSVIHSAAIVKQFGDADLFYKANVKATINLLEFTKLTALKDFHHISTVSVLKNNPDSCQQWGNYCTEEHLPENLELSENNVYLQTKLEAERHVVSYRKGEFNANIYRVGNLAFMLRNISVQENISTVGFTHWLNYFFRSGTIFPDVKTDLSPVDSTAKAVVKLFDKNCSNNSVYHVFNAHPFDLVQYTQWDDDAVVKVLPVPEFIQHVIDELENSADTDSIMRFLLAQGWLDVAGADQFAQIKYLQNKTQSILKQLNFEWPIITNAQFKKYLGHVFNMTTFSE